MKTIPAEEYEPFGDEWKKEISKMTKPMLVNLLRQKLIDLQNFKYQCEFKSRYKKKTELTDMELKWLVYYGKTSDRKDRIKIDDLGQIDYSLSMAFSLLDEHSVFKEGHTKEVFWKRIKSISELNLTALDELKKSE